MRERKTVRGDFGVKLTARDVFENKLGELVAERADFGGVGAPGLIFDGEISGGAKAGDSGGVVGAGTAVVFLMTADNEGFEGTAFFDVE